MSTIEESKAIDQSEYQPTYSFEIGCRFVRRPDTIELMTKLDELFKTYEGEITRFSSWG